MKNWPLQNYFWAILIIGPLPLLFCLFYLFTHFQNLTALEAECERIERKARQVHTSQSKEELLMASLNHPDPHYIDKHIETLTFLVPEIKKIETSLGDEIASQRLHYLKEGQNRLEFTEDAIRSNAIFREIEEKQQRAVELNEEDLKKLLCLVEGITIWPYGPKEGRPQLIIKDFQLEKKTLSPQEKVFVVTLQLIKREKTEPLP